MAENLQRVGEQLAVADEGNEEQAVAYLREYVEKMELELQKICDGILARMDKDLTPSGSKGELKELYFKMKGDCCRCLVLFAIGDAKSEAVEQTKDLQDPDEARKLARVTLRERVQECIVEEIIDV